jgi:ribosomal protein S18 acetylase RimI-like enzyme
MTTTEFESFKEQTIRNYAEENVGAGYWHESEAMARSIEAHQKLLPLGVATEGHYLFSAKDAVSKEKVGYVWFGVEKNVAIASAFIFAVFIYEKFRSRGYGRMMMKLVEIKASELGMRRLGLHVFAQNPIAIHLYQEEGYRITSLNMMKELASKE